MTEPKFGKIKKPIYCSRADTLGKYEVSTGDFILYEEEVQDIGGLNRRTERRFGRVLGTCLRAPNGEEFKARSMLVVMAMGDRPSFGYERYVLVRDVVHVSDELPGAFAMLFMRGEVPSPEDFIKMTETGLMNDRYLGDFLVGPPEAPRVAKNWRDVWKRKLERTGATGS